MAPVADVAMRVSRDDDFLRAKGKFDDSNCPFQRNGTATEVILKMSSCQLFRKSHTMRIIRKSLNERSYRTAKPPKEVITARR